MRELEKAQKCIASRFGRLVDASAKIVADSLRSLNEPMSIDDGPPGS